jgi:hypothetical protein
MSVSTSSRCTRMVLETLTAGSSFALHPGVDRRPADLQELCHLADGQEHAEPRNSDWLGPLGTSGTGWVPSRHASGAEGHWFESSIARNSKELRGRITSVRLLSTFLSTFAAGMLKGILIDVGRSASVSTWV